MKNKLQNKIGFMQGRLSDQINGMIQSFPWDSWEKEFQIAKSINIELMEWTLDYLALYKNPLLMEKEQARIIKLSKKNNLLINSVTGDCFMQKPFWKASDKIKKELFIQFIDICNACSQIGIGILVVPLVDNGFPENKFQEADIISFFNDISNYLKKINMKIAFELEYNPSNSAKFIDKLPDTIFGINYDTGNSASKGFEPDEEFQSYGERIINVHIKDRIINGGTIALGKGSTNFEKVFQEISKINYNGNYILQTARCPDQKHAEKILNYKKFIETFIVKYIS